ncbi:MAG: Flp family type IVb pilin [Limnochordia bacterium]|nr:Flp family type IVb pilin [Limnochordia bacterium]MDD2629109.1 Flp family type IVb pilin [Limnochordia bacterium]MDD4517289.1 Flp family type IVb pilin [Limnochordia bacterium]
MQKNVRRLFQDETGQSMAEYGLLTALIAVVTIAAVKAIGTSISTKFNTLAQEISGTP